jgi:hypothetical protein
MYEEQWRIEKRRKEAREHRDRVRFLVILLVSLVVIMLAL